MKISWSTLYNDKLDQLVQKVQLEVPDSGGGDSNNVINNASIMNLSQVQLFPADGSPTNEPLKGTGLAPDNDGSNELRHTVGGPCHWPS